jgi:hypothetical protein
MKTLSLAIVQRYAKPRYKILQTWAEAVAHRTVRKGDLVRTEGVPWKAFGAGKNVTDSQ